MALHQLPVELLLHIIRYLSAADLLSCVLLSKHFRHILENELYLKALGQDAEEGLPLRSHVVAACRRNLTALKRFIGARPDIDYTQVESYPGKYANLLPEYPTDIPCANYICEKYYKHDEGGMTTLLHIVSLLGQTEILPLILGSGGDVEATDFMGRTAVHVAALGDCTDALRLLINAGADISAFTQAPENEVNDLPHNPAQRTALHYAVSEGFQSTVVQLLLDSGADPSVREIDGWEWSPLLYAAERDDEEIVEMLLNGGADPLSRTLSGDTALHLATSVEVAELLLDACPGLYECLDGNNRAPVEITHSNSTSEDLSVFLIEYGGKLDSPRAFPQTMLHRAIEKCHERVVEALLKKDRTLVQRVNHTGQTALHCAAIYASSGMDVRIAKNLIDAGIDIFAVTEENETAFHSGAGKSSGPGFLKVLLQAGIDAPQWKNRHGDTTQHSIPDTDDVNKDMTPLRVAAKIFFAPNKYGDTPLHRAAIDGHEDNVKYLLSVGVDAWQEDNRYGDTTQCIKPGRDVNKDMAVVGLTETCAKKLFAPNVNGDTPLHLAARNSRKDTVEILLAAGSDPSALNKRGQTPLHVAGTPEIIALLINFNIDASLQSSNNNNTAARHSTAEKNR
ncbi:hypothetical protein FQN54_004120 [Arachnomyces sp. PD_36]|nr:hypothetical protein FQN54_004120 [Arachnomyces sp. PD_36]